MGAQDERSPTEMESLGEGLAFPSDFDGKADLVDIFQHF